MKIIVIFVHRRRNSFTGAVLDAFVDGLISAGHTADVPDFNREGFDPRMKVEDEPIWGNRTQVSSDEIRVHPARVDEADAIAMVFPVRWWSFTSLTKGWIERIWNHG